MEIVCTRKYWHSSFIDPSHRLDQWHEGTALSLSTGSDIQQLPINLRTYKLLAPHEPKAQYNKKKPKQNNGGIIHIARRDRQFGWETDEGSYHRDEQRRKNVADVAHGAEIEGSSGKGGLAAAGDDDALRDGVGDALDWQKPNTVRQPSRGPRLWRVNWTLERGDVPDRGLQR